MGIDVDGDDALREDLEELADQMEGEPATVVGASADHAGDVEFGTDAHTIEADDAEALHFEMDGEEVFVKSVDHPGTEAQPYMRPAAMEIRSNAQEYLEEAESLEHLVVLASVDAVRFAKQGAPVDDGDLQNSIRWESK